MTSISEIVDELDISEILGNREKNELIEVIKKQLNSDNVNFSIENGSKKGDNFMGNIYRILYENENSNQLSLILKMAPKNLIRREKFNIRPLFLSEIDMYSKVLAYFNEFQLSKGVDPEQNGFKEFPKCYSSITEDLSESLFLEDLRIRKFEMINFRKEPITFDHISVMLKALGKFHAISFALKDQQPEKFNQLASLAFERFWTLFEAGDGRSELIRNITRLKSVLKEEKRFDLLEKFQNAIGEDNYAALMQLVSSEAAEPYAVICHGDLTTNNTMFNIDDEGKPMEIQFFDFQFTRYASPVIDLVLYLVCSATKELRDQHYEEFLKIYHDSLSDLLERLGSDSQKIFPYEALLNQLQKFGVYSAFAGAFLLVMLCADLETVPNFDDPNIVFNFSKESKQVYSKMVMDMFVDLDRLGYI